MKCPAEFPLHLAEKTLKTLKGNVRLNLALFPVNGFFSCEREADGGCFWKNFDLDHLSRTLTEIIDNYPDFVLVLIVCLYNSKSSSGGKWGKAIELECLVVFFSS